MLTNIQIETPLILIQQSPGSHLPESSFIVLFIAISVSVNQISNYNLHYIATLPSVNIGAFSPDANNSLIFQLV